VRGFAAFQFIFRGLVFQLTLAGLHPEQMRAGFFKTFVPVLLRDAPRANGKQMPQQTTRDRGGVNERQVVGGRVRVRHQQSFSR
jgi:hypothetical protein